MKNIFKNIKIIAVGLFLVSFVGCQDLSVENENAPDKTRALANPGDTQSLIGGSYLAYFDGSHVFNPMWVMSSMADEGSSSWGNFGSNDMSSEPRIQFNNDPSYSYTSVVTTAWTNLYRCISSANDGIDVIDGGLKIVINGTDHTARAKSFAQFTSGLCHAHIGLYFDQGFVVEPGTDLTTIELSPYDDVIDAGIGLLEEAKAAANAATFTLPAAWINGNALTSTEFAQLIDDHLAVIKASRGRSVADRNAANWTEIMNHVDNGYTQNVGDFNLESDGPPNYTWFQGLHWYGNDATWFRGDYKTMGPADKGTGYSNWLSTPVADRNHFALSSDDKRISAEDQIYTSSSGLDSTAPGKYYTWVGPSLFPASRGTYHFSYYQITRFASYQANNGVDDILMISTNYTNLLKAEGLLRAGGAANIAEAVDLINVSREGVGELNGATIADNVGSPTDAPSALDSGSLWAKLKHEKHMEALMTYAGTAYYDNRGLGDLVSGTPFHFPVPGNQLELLQEAIYTTEGYTPKARTSRGLPTKKY